MHEKFLLDYSEGFWILRNIDLLATVNLRALHRLVERL